MQNSKRTACLGALALAIAACGHGGPAPDLGALYNRAAQHHDETINPIVVVPGLLGTRLVDEASGRVVWGAFGGGAANPRKPDGARLVALPMAEGADFSELRDGVVPDGVLESFKVRIAGLPFSLKAYFDILLTLGVGGYRDASFRLDSLDYGEEHFTCFQFSYDWRRDNVENARRLYEFLVETKRYVAEEQERRFGRKNDDIKFDVISHSMGGVLVRYLLRYGPEGLPGDGSLPELTWKGAELVEKAILVAPPNAGSSKAIDELVRGRKFGPLTPRYQSAILGTFPSSYQLLPRERHGRLVEAGGGRVDPLDPELWHSMGWGLADPDQAEVLEMLLPEVADAGERRRIALDHQAKGLERARIFQAALDLPASPPEGTTLHLIAGDAKATDLVLAADPTTGEIRVVEQAPGDGSVTRASALMDERVGGTWQSSLVSPIDWEGTLFLFTDHLGITKDPGFSDNVLYLLMEQPRK